jgi:hypothetical protein
MMITQSPLQVTPSTIQNTYGAILNTTNKTAPTAPTSAVSDYAVQPSASSPVLSAFFQTLSQIDQKTQNNPSSSQGADGQSQISSSNANSILPTTADSSNALQAFTYSLFQNLQVGPSAVSPTPGSSSAGLGPLPAVTPGANTTYLDNLPTRLNSLSATLKSANPTGGANTLEGLQAAYQSLLNSMGSNGSGNVSSTNSSSLASFLDQMSQNLKSQNVTSINTKGSLLDTKA